MMITVDEVTHSICHWSVEYGIPVALIRSRLRRGWNPERAVVEPMHVRLGERLPDDAHLDLPPKPRPIVSSPHAPLATLPPVQERRAIAPMRRSRLYTHGDKTLSIRGWAAHLGISPQAMHVRLSKQPDRAFDPPKQGWLTR